MNFWFGNVYNTCVYKIPAHIFQTACSLICFTCCVALTHWLVCMSLVLWWPCCPCRTSISRMSSKEKITLHEKEKKHQPPALQTTPTEEEEEETNAQNRPAAPPKASSSSSSEEESESESDAESGDQKWNVSGNTTACPVLVKFAKSWNFFLFWPWVLFRKSKNQRTD